MDFLPPPHQKLQLFSHDPHGATNLTARHVVGPDQFWSALRPNQVDFGFSVPEHVNMRRQMVIDVDDDTQAIGTQDDNHAIE
jgi:hypothetical protein